MPSSSAGKSEVPASTVTRVSDPALAAAIDAVLATGTGLTEPDVLAVLTLPDEDLPAVLAAAHQVRMAWCGPEVEVEGIVSVKTGGCPEDCHFCSQSGVFSSPVRAVWRAASTRAGMSSHTARTGEAKTPDCEQKWQSSGQPPVLTDTMPSTSTSGPHHAMRTSWAS